MAARRQHFIELNGQKYDAVTGARIGGMAENARPVTQSHTGTQLDGFTVKKPQQAHALTPAHKPTRKTQIVAANSVHPKTQKAKTLMRSAVKKPVPLKPERANVSRHTNTAPKITPQPTQTPAVHNTSPERILHAMHTKRSNLISKFGTSAASAIKTAVVPVAQAPAPEQRSAANTPPTATASQKRNTEHQSPFAHAIAAAQSHAQPVHRSQSAYQRAAKKLHTTPKTLGIASSVVAVFIGIAVIGYTQIPQLTLQVASTRAGINAALPSYKPSGFTLNGPIAYENGEVSLQYKSTTDERDYSIVQRASSWNSDALLAHIASDATKPYQTYQANGRTIYIYGDNNATWVDGGVWYQIKGNANLTSDQLLKIASGL